MLMGKRLGSKGRGLMSRRCVFCLLTNICWCGWFSEPSQMGLRWPCPLCEFLSFCITFTITFLVPLITLKTMYCCAAVSTNNTLFDFFWSALYCALLFIEQAFTYSACLMCEHKSLWFRLNVCIFLFFMLLNNNIREISL